MPDSAERIRVACSCGALLRVPKTAQGKRVKCPKCAAAVTVPANSATSGERITRPAAAKLRKPVDPRTSPSAAIGQTSSGSVNDDEQLLQLEIELAAKQPTPSDVDVTPRKKLSASKLKKLRQQLEVQNPLSDSELVSRRLALLELGQSCDDRVLEELIAHATDDSSIIREGALTALGDFGDPQAVPVVLNSLLDKDDDVIRAALTTIRKIGDHRVVRPLLRFGIECPRWKAAANDALVKLGSRAVQELLVVLQKSDPGLTLDAIVILGRIGDKQAVPSLIACLDHVSNLLRAHVTEALALIGDSRAVPQMLRALTDPIVAVRVNAAAGLVRMADPRTLVSLMNALQDEDADVRRYAAVAVGELGDSKIVPDLMAIVEGWEQLVGLDPDFLQAIVEALGKLKDARAVPVLIPLLRVAHEGVLLKTVLALKQLRDPSASAALIAVLNSSKPALRRRIVETLGHAGDLSVIPAIGKVLREDTSPEVRATAARALGELKAKEACPFLQDALRDDFAVRCQAVIALGAIRDKSTLPALMAMLKDSAPEIRYHAINAAAKLNELKTLKALAVMLEDSDQMVRAAAEKAIEQFGDAANDKAVQQIVKRVRSRNLAAMLLPSWLFLLVPRKNAARGRIAAVLAASLLLGFVIKTAIIGGPAQITVRGNVQALTLNADGSLLVAERTLGMLEVWDVNAQTVKKQAGIIGFRNPQFAGKDQIVLLSGESVVPWPLRGVPDSSLGWKEHKQPITKFAATPDGKFAVTMAKDMMAVKWDLARGKKVVDVEIGDGFPDALTISPDGQRLASANRRGEVRIIEADGGQEVLRLPGKTPPSALTALTLSPDGKWLAAVEQTGGLRIWDLTAPADAPSEKTIAPKVPLHVVCLRILSDSKRVLTADAGGEIRLWDLETDDSKLLCTAELDQVDGFAISGDEKRIACGGNVNSMVQVFDIESGELLKKLDVRGR